MIINPPIQFVIITGMSGAGKTQALKCLEDQGFFCVDNLPPALIPKLAELCLHSEGRVNQLALGIDIRGGEFFDSVLSALDGLERDGFPFKILFLEASDDALVRRYKESRHRHPLAQHGRIIEAIAQERQLLDGLRGRAARVIDTTNSSIREFRGELVRLFAWEEGEKALSIHVLSFGFKHGLPLDADLVFDVRFLPNPHYIPELKALTGHADEVQAYVNRWDVTQKFFRRLTGMIGFLIPHYAAEGKAHLTIAIGCTGGQHRSVVLALRLTAWLRKRGFRVAEQHRDVVRDLRGED